ncbi:virB8 family protein [Marinobacterium arenosum]|uniref:virB8 family protein n=1 Tax=Marinobacterium arenosum TaxID=2862496 RepID=UPI001C944101|nr:VirB8/TrbF family protein [Marinobacterium arenosum]MBY4677959.1 Type IV secretory pathway component [Marinobacterium arenosum]
MTDKISAAELERRYFDEANGWERDITTRLRTSERRAWRIAVTACLVAFVAVGAVAALTPLKSVEPFVIRVDQSTGIVDIVQALQDGQANYDEVVNKYFLSKYIQHRERYLPETRDYDRRVVGLMSDAATAQVYAEYTDPRRNPSAPIALYGDTARVDVSIKNISFISPQVALIRYTKKVERAGQQSPASHWVATVPFTYIQAPIGESDRLVNPLGFQVRDYRNDPETVLGG